MAHNHSIEPEVTASGNGGVAGDTGQRPETRKPQPNAGAGPPASLPLFSAEMEPIVLGESEQLLATWQEREIHNAILYLRARARQGAQTPALKILRELYAAIIAEREGRNIISPAHRSALKRQRKKAKSPTLFPLTNEGEKCEN